MSNRRPPERRRVVQFAVALPAALSLGSQRAHAQQPQMPTARDAQGPFFVANTPVVRNLNRHGKPGQAMRIVGRILSAQAPHRPVSGARLQLWQTDGAGKYHPAAQGDYTQFRDQDVDMRGTLMADADGRFEVMSLFPTEYWPRPPHIHYWIHAPGFVPLVTQHYLDTPPLNRPHRTAQVDRRSQPAVFTAPTLYLEPL